MTEQEYADNVGRLIEDDEGYCGDGEAKEEE